MVAEVTRIVDHSSPYDEVNGMKQVTHHHSTGLQSSLILVGVDRSRCYWRIAVAVVAAAVHQPLSHCDGEMMARMKGTQKSDADDSIDRCYVTADAVKSNVNCYDGVNAEMMLNDAQDDSLPDEVMAVTVDRECEVSSV